MSAPAAVTVAGVTQDSSATDGGPTDYNALFTAFGAKVRSIFISFHPRLFLSPFQT